jgi:uncharacterized protein DUF6978
MSLTQSEADLLLALPKHAPPGTTLELSTSTPMDQDWELMSHDRREEFILTIERGRRKTIRLKFQTRAKTVIVLARLDIDGGPHRNPPGQPYRPGELLASPHLHLYREGYDDRVAYLLNELPGGFAFSLTDDLIALTEFLEFSAVDPIPPIQRRI